MESTVLKAENLKPVILKAGVPLVSLAGLIYAWIIAKKNLSTKVSSLSNNEADSAEINSHQGSEHEESFDNFSYMEDEEEPSTPMNSSVLSGSLVIHNNNNLCLEQEVTGLKSQIEGLQMRELALRLQFELYCEMREQESLLQEIKNMLSLETARVEFLDREISSIETETKKLEKFVVRYMRVIQQLEYLKSENRVLQRKVHKLRRESKAKSHFIKEQALKIKGQEAEILRNHDALQTRVSVINKLEDEIRELHGVLDQLQDEKNELVKKLDTTEAYASKLYKEKIHRKPLKYYLQVKKEHENGVEELIHLRRSNVCLRQELMRIYEQQKDQDKDHVEIEFEGNGRVMQCDSEHDELHDSLLEQHNVSCIGAAHSERACSKRRKLLKRIKKWVEGNEKVRVKPENKFLDGPK
ncbi:hypothetical protein RJT34_22473 [Clitoria ternatea]|uniref:Uncharacterized protein n=1 Tax=Clitoria ternatea TaxID=43366 RepID=A0AAN9FK58_CLITE